MVEVVQVAMTPAAICRLPRPRVVSRFDTWRALLAVIVTIFKMPSTVVKRLSTIGVRGPSMEDPGATLMRLRISACNVGFRSTRVTCTHSVASQSQIHSGQLRQTCSVQVKAVSSANRTSCTLKQWMLVCTTQNVLEEGAVTV